MLLIFHIDNRVTIVFLALKSTSLFTQIDETTDLICSSQAMTESDDIGKALYTSNEPLNIVTIPMSVRRRDDPVIMTGKTSKYIRGEVLDSGSYAQVFDVVDMTTLQRKAVKVFEILKKRRLTDGNDNKVADVLEEARIVRSLNHKNVLKLYEVFQEKTVGKIVIYVVMDYCAATVEEMRKAATEGRLPVCVCHAIFKQVINGLEYIHSRGFVHRDIKPDNLLVTNCRTIKIADFGSSARLETFSTSDVLSSAEGSYWYQPPEVLPLDLLLHDNSYHGFLVDSWAAGVTLYRISTGHYPFVAETDFVSELYQRIKSASINKHHVLDRNPFLFDLISKMLIVYPSQRLGIQGVKHHLWFMNEETEIPADLIPTRVRFEVKSDKYRSMTMTPSLHQLHYPDYDVVNVSDKEYEEFEAKKTIPLLRPNRSPIRGKKSLSPRTKRGVTRVRGFF